MRQVSDAFLLNVAEVSGALVGLFARVTRSTALLANEAGGEGS